MKKHLTILMLMLISLLSLTGCWNSRELSDMAMVIGIGVDRVPDSDQYRVSLQIVNPNMAAGTKTGGSGQNMLPNIVYSSVDHTLFSAFRKTSQKVSRRSFFAHSQLLVIGESLAKEGIDGVFDFFERSHELRLTSAVVIARGGEAKTLLNVLTPLQTTTATSIKDKLKLTSEVWAQSVDGELTDVIKSLSGSGEPAISGVRLVGDSSKGNQKANLDQSPPHANIETKGIAIFSNGKLASWLDGNSARGAVWALNKMKSTIINLDCEGKTKALSIEIIRSSTKARVMMRGGKPVLTLHVKEEGHLSETNCPINPNNRELIVKLQKQVAEETKKEIETAVKATQSKKSDIFGFSTEMERTHPKEWKKMRENWPLLYSESEVEVRVEAYIRRTGLRVKSYMKPKNE